MKRLTDKRWRLVLAAISMIGMMIALVGARRVWAASAPFSYDTNVTYTVVDNTTTRVEEVYNVTNNTASQYLTELKLTTPSDKLTNLRVFYNDGGRIATTVATKKSSDQKFNVATQEITMTFPRVNAGQGARWQFTVSYETVGLVETKGSAHTVYVPAVDAGDLRRSYHIMVDVPQSFGEPHFASGAGKLEEVNDGRQRFSFTREDVAKHSLALVFGTSTIYDLNFNFPVNNDSPIPRTLTVALPPDLGTQSSVIASLDPAPVRTRLDADGNVLADYALGPHQRITVSTKVDGTARYRSYDLSKSGKKSAIPADLVAQYTRATRYWPTDGAVAAAARSVVKPDAPVAENVHAVYRYVIDKLTYNNDKIKFNVRQGAGKALANPSNAVCLEYADLMIAMLRSQGIPARMLVGYAYSGSLKASPGVADSLHSWVEAYVPGVGWMSVDPTWGEKFDDFGRADLDHFAFAVWGRNDATPGAIMAGGADLGYQYEATKLAFASSAPSITPSGSLHIDRLVVLPFVSLDSVSLTAQAQQVTEKNRLSIGGRTLSLGTLAPAQAVSFVSLVLGGSWHAPSSALLQYAGPSGDVLIAKTTVQLHYWPLLALLAAILVVWLVALYTSRWRRKPTRVRSIYRAHRRSRDILDE